VFYVVVGIAILGGSVALLFIYLWLNKRFLQVVADTASWKDVSNRKRPLIGAPDETENDQNSD
jgi:hypothetical protein